MENTYALYYNAQFDTLLVAAGATPVTSVEQHDGVVVLRDDANDVVGLNILAFSERYKMTPSHPFATFDPVVCSLVAPLLRQYLPNVPDVVQFRVGRVESCAPIPDTHLHACMVNVDHEVLPIVCGATNVATQQLVVVACVGA